MSFHDRYDAGRQLAAKLMQYARRDDVLVLALPRGGVPVGFEVAQALGAPLDIFLVRKLGLPGHEELAMGAIATGGVRVLNERVMELFQPSNTIIDRVAARERHELERREHEYRNDLPPPEIRGKTILLVDDGLATGSTMRAAVTALRSRNPARIVLAVPVCASASCAEFRELADEIICVEEPEYFYAVGQAYETFEQTTDEEVRDLIARSTNNAICATKVITNRH